MKFYYFKKVIYVNNVDIEKILISDKFTYDKSKEANAKYFIGHKTGKKWDHYTMSFHKWQNLFINLKKSPLHVLFNQR